MEPILDATVTAAEKTSLLRCMRHFEIFAPSLAEIALLAGEGTLEEQIRWLAALGPRVVTVRQGALGSLVYDREADCFWRIPAAAADVVDVTGAGNAYCGGFLVGWVETGDVVRSAAMAAVSAAVTIEQVGPAPVDAAAMARAQRRAAEVMQEIRPLLANDLEKG
jgi:sugar/nucleoside kinase (ribokinase family)